MPDGLTLFSGVDLARGEDECVVTIEYRGQRWTVRGLPTEAHFSRHFDPFDAWDGSERVDVGGRVSESFELRLDKAHWVAEAR